MSNAEAIAAKYPGLTVLQADGFDDAITGYDSKAERLIYSVDKCIEILSREMTEEEATEYFYFNVAGSYVGKHTPIFEESSYE